MDSLIDTHRLVAGQKARGFTDDQSEGVVEIINELISSHLATKKDLELELRRQELRQI